LIGQIIWSWRAEWCHQNYWRKWQTKF